MASNRTEKVVVDGGGRRRSKPNPRLSNPPNHIHGEQVAAGWPSWLSAIAGEALNGWTPRSANSFEKIDKIGQGTYSNVYRARDSTTGEIVALKKVRFDKLEPESMRFMAREILALRRLDHPNVVKLQGLVTSRMSSSLYLVFDYMDHDLSGLASSVKFTEPQVKCYMHQLLSGLEHCHKRDVLHRDIKCSNLLINERGILKIADFGLASIFDLNSDKPMTNRVVTLWYRPIELLLGATNYGVGVDLWSAGCILAELFAGGPIMTGRTEVEQLHRIFKLCGSPSEEFLKKANFSRVTMFKPEQSYARCIRERFRDFPTSALSLIETLLAIDPCDRQTATAALESEFFITRPYACDPSSLPRYPPSKEMDAIRREEEEARSCRSRGAGKSENGSKKARARERRIRAMPAHQAILDRRLSSDAIVDSKSEKFPPPHQDGGIGFSMGLSHQIDLTLDPPNALFTPMNSTNEKDSVRTWSGSSVNPSAFGALRRKSRTPSKMHSPK